MNNVNFRLLFVALTTLYCLLLAGMMVFYGDGYALVILPLDGIADFSIRDAFDRIKHSLNLVHIPFLTGLMCSISILCALKGNRFRSVMFIWIGLVISASFSILWMVMENLFPAALIAALGLLFAILSPNDSRKNDKRGHLSNRRSPTSQ